MHLLEIVYWICGAVLSVPVTVLAVQILLAAVPLRPLVAVGNRNASVAVLVPAHNEAKMIRENLRLIKAQLQGNDRLVVVADNCDDRTAEIARGVGAEVLERFNDLERGKGYALDYGLEHLRARPPEIVIIVDADCRVQTGALNRLALACEQRQRPVQALYLMHAPENPTLKSKVAEFAWIVKNLVRPLGYSRLRLPCQLMGAGMAIPWYLFSKTSVADGNIVEDLKLGIELAVLGKPPCFCPDAVVTSTFAANRDGASTQRTRWEHGHLGMICSQGPKLLVRTARAGNVGAFSLVLDMCVPPLALLTIFVFAWSMAGVMLQVVIGSETSQLATLMLPLMLFVAVMLAWFMYGRQAISLKNLAFVPFYVLSKIPLYFKFLLRRQVEWVRAKRD